MMEEISLTGATTLSSTAKKAGGNNNNNKISNLSSALMANDTDDPTIKSVSNDLIDKNSDNPLGSLLNTKVHHHHGQHGHGHHGHHGGGGGSSCCSNHKMTMRQQQPSKPLPIEQILALSSSDLFKSVSTLIRLGTYETFEPLGQAIIDKHNDTTNDFDKSSLLDVLGQSAEGTNADSGGHTLVHWASKRKDDIRFLSWLLEHCKKETINLQSNDNVGMRPVHWSCTEGSIPHVAKLLKAGANIEGTDNSGCTPLLIAAQYGHVELVGFLAQRGSCMDSIDTSGDTALHWAAYKGSIQVCGLLLHQGLSDYLEKPDKYGQTPLHLASLRGHTSVVRYILNECPNVYSKRNLLSMQDKNGKTPIDLAIQKKRPTVAAVLQEQMDILYIQKSGQRINRYITCMQRNFRSIFSLHKWSIWIGCISNSDEVDEAPTLPFAIVIFHITFALLWYPFIFTPFQNTASGILWDKMGLHLFTLVFTILSYYLLYKVHTTNPGYLSNTSKEYIDVLQAYKKQYELEIEKYADESYFSLSNQDKEQLCHTCRIVRPLRSKHCKVARCCVLLFDHHCPFVGTTIGLYNYKHFYFMLLSIFLAFIGWFVTLGIYLHRCSVANDLQFSYFLLFLGIYMLLFFFMDATLLVYHTQLTLINLTTNEHQNLNRYKYLKNPTSGKYYNPFFQGLLGNIYDRLFHPSDKSYTPTRSIDSAAASGHGSKVDSAMQKLLGNNESNKKCCEHNHSHDHNIDGDIEMGK